MYGRGPPQFTPASGYMFGPRPPIGMMPYGGGGPPITMQPTANQVFRGPGPQIPNDYLCCNITMLCCFCPIGIFGLIASCATRNAIQQGDLFSAQQCSMHARNLAIAAGVFGALSILGGIIYSIVNANMTGLAQFAG